MQPYLDELVIAGRQRAQTGKVATYIPALATADINWVAVCIAAWQEESLMAGDWQTPFTLQSISKVFALLYVLETLGAAKVFQHIGCEASGHPFYSLVQLEYEQGRPRNPLINAGAIAISALFPGQTTAEKIAGYLHFLQSIAGEEFQVDATVYRSEAETGHRNRAVAHFMRSFGVIETDPQLAVETYFQQCSILVTVEQLANLGLIFACRGRHPRTQFAVNPENVKIVNALMSSCGLYDEAGWFALNVGIPAKSGVSGGLLAIAPGRYSLATFGPALNEKGNSIAGLYILQRLANSLGLSLYL